MVWKRHNLEAAVRNKEDTLPPPPTHQEIWKENHPQLERVVRIAMSFGESRFLLKQEGEGSLREEYAYHWVPEDRVQVLGSDQGVLGFV